LILAFSSNSLFVGGKGGNFASLSGGGIFLLSTELALVVDDPPWLKLIPETVELKDSVLSLLPLLTSCVDDFLGGSIGLGWEAFLPGNGGGALRAGRGGVLAVCVGVGWSLSTGGGGRRLFFTPIGWLLACFVTEEPYVTMGGLLVVCVLEGMDGRFVGTEGRAAGVDCGSGGGARFPKV
jgi:hypothetical protein